MTPPPDLLEALVSFLRADTDVSALVGARVFRPELPEAETQHMPRKALVLQRAGGGVLVGRDTYLQVGDQRVDVIAWGGSPGEAAAVHRAAYAALKQLRREISEGALIHWAQPEQAPISLRDPDTDWPFERSSWQVLVSDLEVA